MANYWERVTRERLGRRRLLKAGAAFSMGAAALALVGCGDDDDGGTTASPTTAAGETPGASPAADQPRQGGHFGYYNNTMPDSYDPHNNWLEGHVFSSLHVYDHLISSRVGDFAPYKLEAAESIETPDDLTVVVTLKPSKYHNKPPVNGRDVAASDIVASQAHAKDAPGLANSFQRQYLELVEATDDKTVVFHLTRPNAYLFTGTQFGEQAAMLILPEEILDNLASTEPVGSGPYILDKHTLGANYTWVRNPDWREGSPLPYIETREMLLLADSVAQEAAFRAGQIHRWGGGGSPPPAADYERLLNEFGDKAYGLEFETLSPWTLNLGGKKSFNLLKRDDRAREAIYRTINRQQFIDLLFNGKGTVPPGILTGAHKLYQVDPKDTEAYWANDLTKAKQLIEAVEGALDKEWEIMVFGTAAGLSAQSGQIAQTQLAEIGLKTRVNALPVSEGLPKAQSGEWEFFTGPHPAYDSPQTPMRQQHTESRNEFANTGLEDPEIDALIEKSEIATDPEENQKLVKEIQVECIKRFGPYIQLMTRFNQEIHSSLLMDFKKDWDPATTVTYYTPMWLKDA